MMKSSPALLLLSWKALRTHRFFPFLLMGGMGLFLMALGQAARYQGWTLSGCGVLSLLFGWYWRLSSTAVQPGHQSKAKRIRKWKSRGDEYAYDDFCAVRSGKR
jgi:hypothetical protein